MRDSGSPPAGGREGSVMRIVAFSDPHREVAAAHRVRHASAAADVVVGAGDFGDRGRGARDTLDVLADLHCPLVIVSGNHDRVDELADFAATHAGVHLLHGDGVDIDGVRFVGLGSAVARAQPSPNSEWLHEDEAARLLAAHVRCDVLVTHTPPRGAADVHPSGRSGGSEAVRAAVLRLAPALCLCGHVHRSHGVRVRLGPTRVHNLGPVVSRHRVERLRRPRATLGRT